MSATRPCGWCAGAWETGRWTESRRATGARSAPERLFRRALPQHRRDRYQRHARGAVLKAPEQERADRVGAQAAHHDDALLLLRGAHGRIVEEPPHGGSILPPCVEIAEQ